jgi:hypothetical protein
VGECRSGNGAVVELWEWASGESMGEAWTVGWTGLSDDQVKDKVHQEVHVYVLYNKARRALQRRASGDPWASPPVP